MSETKRNLECVGCRAYITTFTPGTGWVCRWCGPRTPEQMREPEVMSTRLLTVKSLGARSALKQQLTEIDTLGNREPDEDHIFQLFDGAQAQHHHDFLLHLLDIMQLKLGQEIEDGWWVARKRPSDPSYKHPYKTFEPTKIEGTGHVIII